MTLALPLTGQHTKSAPRSLSRRADGGGFLHRDGRAVDEDRRHLVGGADAVGAEIDLLEVRAGGYDREQHVDAGEIARRDPRSAAGLGERLGLRPRAVPDRHVIAGLAAAARPSDSPSCRFRSSRSSVCRHHGLSCECASGRAKAPQFQGGCGNTADPAQQHRQGAVQVVAPRLSVPTARHYVRAPKQGRGPIAPAGGNNGARAARRALLPPLKKGRVGWGGLAARAQMSRRSSRRGPPPQPSP